MTTNGLRCPRCKTICEFYHKESTIISNFSVDEALSHIEKQKVNHESDKQIKSNISGNTSNNVTNEDGGSLIPAVIFGLLLFMIIVPNAIELILTLGFFTLIGLYLYFAITHDGSSQQPRVRSLYYNQSTGKVEHIIHNGEINAKQYIRTVRNNDGTTNQDYFFKVK